MNTSRIVGATRIQESLRLRLEYIREFHPEEYGWITPIMQDEGETFYTYHMLRSLGAEQDPARPNYWRLPKEADGVL